MTTRSPKLCCFGLGGDSVEYGGGCRGSGYGSPESPHAVHLDDCPDGTPVIDKRDILSEKPHLSYKSPLCNPDVPDGVIDECPAPDPLFAQAVSENPYGTLLAVHEANKTRNTPGPLGSVSVNDYVAWWRSHGARIGQVIDHQIAWE